VPYVRLTEVGVAFDTVNSNLSMGSNRDPAYLQVNSKGKVPALIMDGQPLTENIAIQMWIALHFPDAKLLPEDPMDAMRAISVMAWCASAKHPKIT
jgi:glutathione S-transferase